MKHNVEFEIPAIQGEAHNNMAMAMVVDSPRALRSSGVNGIAFEEIDNSNSDMYKTVKPVSVKRFFGSGP